MPKKKSPAVRYGVATVVTPVPFNEVKMLAGMRCPSCEQHVQMYCRKLNRSMVRQLAWLVKRYNDNNGNWINVGAAAPRWMVRTPQLGILKHWGMIERKPVEDGERRTSGTYRPTAFGIAFIKGFQHAPSEVFLYNDTVRAWGATLVRAHEVVDGFDYSLLMKRGIALLNTWPKGTLPW